MEGPFTCEELRNIGPRVIQVELDKFVHLIVQDIKKSIIDKASIGILGGVSEVSYDGRPTPSKYQIIYDTNRLSGHKLVNMNILHRHVKRPDTISNVVTQMTAIFPDMKIVVDPLQTYILFDWSP